MSRRSASPAPGAGSPGCARRRCPAATAASTACTASSCAPSAPTAASTERSCGCPPRRSRAATTAGRRCSSRSEGRSPAQHASRRGCAPGGLHLHPGYSARVPALQPRIAPSILAADFGHLAAQVREVVDAGARVIHVDIMDGHFVPPFSMGPQVCSALRALDLDIELDVHLMVERPERHVADFAKAGASNITIHAEATPHLNYTVQQIRELG